MVSVIVAGARTPMGRLQGSLSTLTAPQLAGVAIRAALERSGFAPGEVDQALVGQVLQAGVGQSPARQAAVAGGLPMSVPATAINKVCLSGLNAVAMADALITAGMADVVVAAGTESMSAAPHLLPGSRSGHMYGDVALLDHMAHDGLRDTFTSQPMGTLTDDANDPADPTGTAGPPGGEPGTATAARWSFTREEQDAFAARSHRLAAAAWESGVFAEEVVPVQVPRRKGEPVTVDRDEGIRPGTTVETLGGLRPAFRPDGTITAGSSSPISDGAAAVVVARKDLVESRGLPWLAEVGAAGTVAGPDSTLQTQPSAAVREACRREGIDPAGLDRYEINEAFAVVGLASAADLGLTPEQVEERVNVHGGAIALGHPIGMSGTRLALTLALELRRLGGGTGVAALCGGGGQGEALLLRVPRA
ncbi:acetyl-CoA C-acyltransferase [Aquipuribacter hungaricus]|uniref:Probable acetyl-CoA acetyltransferase n=1 Tax=Aquipuribacter hungaricus TaxID=545624 RepID=A0ABV7WH69_9MICO